MSKRMVNINGYYRHFKGNLYQVDGIAKREDNRQWQVIYHRCDLDDTQTPIHWIRPMDEFLSPIDHTKYPTYTQKYRFVEENYDFFSD